MNHQLALAGQAGLNAGGMIDDQTQDDNKNNTIGPH